MSSRQLIPFAVAFAIATQAGIAGAASPSAGFAPPTNTSPPSISGTAQVGAVQTANVGIWSGKAMKYAYQWQRCDSSGANCGAIVGATAATYTAAAADQGKTLRVVVIASNKSAATAATSGPTPVIASGAAVPPTWSAPPTISGVPQQGQTLSASAGSVSGTQPIAYSYQWQRCASGGVSCSSVSGATATSYSLGSADVGFAMRVIETSTNSVGSATDASGATSLVAGSSGTTTTGTTTTGSTTTGSTTTTTPSTGSTPSGSPYWTSNFLNADLCPAWDSVMESATVNPLGYYDPCLNTVVNATDTARRVYLTQDAGNPAGTTSTWASHQEIRTTDLGWGGDQTLDKSTLSLTSQRTFNGPFAMGMTRWFRFSFLLPNNGPGETFNWPANDWYLLADLHVSVDGNGDAQDMKVQPWSGNPRYITFVLEGASSTDSSEWEFINMLQLTDASGNRISGAFNTWHTVILGVTFSAQGVIGNSPGHLTIIFDGKTIYDQARPTARTGETGPWFQLQNYKSHAAGFVGGATSSTIYYADARIGNSLADVSG